MIAYGQYPRGSIQLHKSCISLTQQFKKDLKSYLNDHDEKQAVAFREDYGYWVDLKVDVGGKLFSTKAVSYDAMEIGGETEFSFSTYSSPHFVCSLRLDKPQVSVCFGGSHEDRQHRSGG